MSEVPGHAVVAKFEKVLHWIAGKAVPQLSNVDVMASRLCRNFRIDLRPDYPRREREEEGPSSASHLANDVLRRACHVGLKLKLVLDAVVLARTTPDPVPKFLTPVPVSLDLPAFSQHVDEEKLQAVFGRLLYAFLMRVWTPLRFSEDLVGHLNAYCAGMVDLARDGAAAPRANDANAVAVAVLEQLRRLESNLSRIEAFVITKHHQAAPSHATELQQLRSQLMGARLTEAEYRRRKGELLDRLVDFNLQQFRPTIFFLLAAPDDAARASVSPHMMLDKTLDQMVREAVQQPSPSSSQPTIDDLMALAAAPLAAAQPSTSSSARNTVSFASAPVANPLAAAPPVPTAGATKSPRSAARNTVAFTAEAPVANPLTGETAAASSSLGRDPSRNTVSFAPRELERLNELERMKASSSSSAAAAAGAALVSPSSSVPKSLAGADQRGRRATISKAEPESVTKVLELPRAGTVTLKVEYGSAFVVPNQVVFLSISVDNQAKGAVVEGMELTLRDPNYAKIVHAPNCLEKWSRATEKAALFPLRTGSSASVRYGLHLPGFLEPVVARSRYTLTLAPFGKKLKSDKGFQLSVPLAVTVADKLHEYVPTQVFSTPIDYLLARRDNSPLPRVLVDVVKFVAERGMPAPRSFSADNLSEEDEDHFLWLRESYNRGDGSLLGVRSVPVVAKLFVNFFMSLPESLVPPSSWPAFKAAVGHADELQRVLELRRLVVALPAPRRTILFELCNFVARLDKAGAFALSFEFLGPCVCRPAERSFDALSIAETGITHRIVALLVKLAPWGAVAKTE